MPHATIHGIRLYYEERNPSAPGLPVLMLHGWTANHSVWEPQAGALSKTHRVILVDHRGHGDSDKPRGDYAIDTFAGDAVALLDMLSVRRCVVVGHSMGGMIAQRLTIDHPERVAALALCATSAKVVDTVGMRLLTLLNGFLLRVAFRAAIGLNMKLAHARPIDKAALRREVEDHLRTPPHAVRAAYRGFLRNHDTRDGLRRLKLPVLIIAGTRDRLLPHRMSLLMHELIAGSKLVLLEGAGHEHLAEEPERTTAALEELLRLAPAESGGSPAK